MTFRINSGNVLYIQKLLNDYGSKAEISPQEYIATFIEQSPEDIEESKLLWITNSFLGIKKHEIFFKGICSHVLLQTLTDEEQQLSAIFLYEIIFYLDPKDMSSLYKCLFNLSKNLLNVLSNFLSNIEDLQFISELAQGFYDTQFVKDKIMKPLFVWQPCLREMQKCYQTYVNEIELMKKKLPTVPQQPNVLNHKSKSFGKEISIENNTLNGPGTPPNSISVKTKKMLTKSAIDEKLKIIHTKNKERAQYLLSEVKNIDSHYAQAKSENIKRTEIKIDKDFIERKALAKFDPKCLKSQPSQPVKDNVATLKRLNKQMQNSEEKEIKWLQNILKNCSNDTFIEDMEEKCRQDEEKERIVDIQKKHLMGQISYEEAIIAKKKVVEENKRKYDKHLKEKEIWNKEIEQWKKNELEKNKKSVERLSLIELRLLQAKFDVASKKKNVAFGMKKESEKLRAEILKKKQEELERKVQMIKEIKIIFILAQNARVPKIIDLTKTSGFGLLSEMSIAELQERLAFLKINLKEDLENRKNRIKEQRAAQEKELNDIKISVKSYLSEKAKTRTHKSRINPTEVAPTQEIQDLKKILEEKRKLREELFSQ